MKNLPMSQDIRVHDYIHYKVNVDYPDILFYTAFMYYYDNPKGMIPTWLINWVAKVRLNVLGA